MGEIEGKTRKGHIGLGTQRHTYLSGSSDGEKIVKYFARLVVQFAGPGLTVFFTRNPKLDIFLAVFTGEKGSE